MTAAMLSLTLTERPDKVALKRIARHKMVYDHDRDRLEVFADSIGEDGIKIKYSQKTTDEGEGYGRLYPRPYRLNSTYMWGRIRSTLFAETETDVDIANCQPSCLLGYCEKMEKDGKMNPEDYMSLKEYVDDRDGIIDAFTISQDAIDEFNRINKDDKTKKDVVKNLVVIITFGGTVDSWAKHWGFEREDYKVTRWFKMFEMEIHHIAKVVVENDPKKKIAIDMWRRNDAAKNYPAPPPEDKDVNYKKVLALILQNKEAEIVVRAIKILLSKGIHVTSYIYDGFQVVNSDLLTDELLEEISDKEFNCKFIKKPFRESLPMGDAFLNEEPPEHFRPSLFNTIGNSSKSGLCSAATLKQQQKYFEKYFAILEGSARIMEKNGEKIYYHSGQNLKLRFANLRYCEKNDKGKMEIKKFVDWWMEQPDRLSYRSVEMRPPPLRCPANVLNTWEGWEIEKVPLVEGRSIQPIMDLFDIVCGRDKDCVEYLLKWFAHKVQMPGKKTLVAPVFYSAAEGTGKTTIAEDIFKAFMMDKAPEYMMSTSTIDDVLSRFSTAAEHLVCVLNEATGSDVIQKSNPLKSFITDNSCKKEVKGIMAEQITNICDIIFTTNNINSIKIGQYDRRFVVFETDASVANNRAIFSPIISAVNDVNVMRTFYQYLKDMDLSGFAPSEMRPKTSIYKEMKSATLSTLQGFWLDFVDSIECDQFNCSGYYYNKYAEYCEQNGRGQRRVPQDKFVSQCKREVKGVLNQRKYVNGRQARCLVINYEAITEWAKNNRAEDSDETKIDYGFGNDSEEECDGI